MMTTPICDFLSEYNKSRAVRFHMPGHKGKDFIGCEALDITEISGADSLFEADGIIRRSEENAGRLFGTDCFYSTEGSSLCIRGMVYLFKRWAGSDGIIFASRNAHKAFITAVSLLDVKVEWIPQKGNYLSGSADISLLEANLSKSKVKTAVYITSPDYLGGIADIKAIGEICKKHSSLLMVDNAHGAYLKFLPESRHPMDLGADICCDSAHKTLPVLTGGAYLHIAKGNRFLSENAKDALALFASTSPSYLILQSLDKANKYISDSYKESLGEFIESIKKAKANIIDLGYTLIGDEPLKLTLATKGYGYYGYEIAEILKTDNIHIEFADRDFAVMMFTPENGNNDIKRLVSALENIPRKTSILEETPKIGIPERVLTPHQALFAESEIISARDSLGRIFAGFNIACPPAVPIVIGGERIDENALKAFEYYGIEYCRTVK